jgi:AcrR family transcriptional regulator
VKSLPDGPAPTIGLRERKKAKTRAAIKEHAMRLFREQGYDVTTVDQIAEAAEVSPSTFFRYFPTKEDVVLTDDFDPVMIASFQNQPPEMSPLAAIRTAMRTSFLDMSEEDQAREWERHQLIRAVPELRSAALDDYRRSMGVMAELVADRVGRDPGEFAVQVFAGALVGVALSTIDSAAPNSFVDFVELLDKSFALLEQGLPL